MFLSLQDPGGQYPVGHEKTTLDNGLRILSLGMPHTCAVSIGFFIGVGSRFEDGEENGISHFLEHMLFKGTEKRPTAREIAVTIEGVGGAINATTGRELTTYWVKVPQGHLALAIDLLVDMLQCSKLEEEEIERERRVIIEEINMMLDFPADWVHLLLNQLVWPGHPLGRDVTGTKESVSKIDRERMFRYLARHYHPANTVVSVAGRIEHEEVVEELSLALEAWPRKEREAYLPVEEAQREPRVCLGYRETEQAHLALSLQGIPRSHPDRFNLQLLNTVLGQGMSSRLFLEVREKRGLAYSISSYVNYLHDTGRLGVFAGVDPRRIEAALEAILGELDRLRGEPVPAEELKKAKEFMKGRLLLQMEDSFAVASWLGRQEILEDRVLTVDEVLAAIDAVTAEDIQRVASERFREESLNLAVVGPFQEEERVRSLLRL
ncbi:MAG TPA: insulinase family protein [Chloroflexi bacterium]|nr:insulinase family protein [Chloroflexota bacterium]